MPSQPATAFAGGGAQGVHEAPHVVGLVLDTQADPQRWCPAGQLGMHVPALQRALPPAGGGQSTSSQQAAVAMQPSRQRLPPGQVKSHAPALQSALPLGGTGHGSQRLPQLLTWLLGSHRSPGHAWVPIGHSPLHASPAARQLFLLPHKRVPVGQVGTHAVPLQPT